MHLRKPHGMASDGEFIYVCGGIVGVDGLSCKTDCNVGKSCERYSLVRCVVAQTA